MSIKSNLSSVIDATAYTGLAIADTVGLTAHTVGKTAVNITAGLAKTIGDNFLKYDPDYGNITGVRLSGKGKAVAGMIAIGGSILGANNTYDKVRMGTPTGETLNSTPTLNRSVNPNGQGFAAAQNGAGGDLVFALNTNRRG